MLVILLRGINVGGNNKLPMADLRRLIERSGGRRPTTYIQSGNAVCDGELDSDVLESAIDAEFGFRPAVLVLDADRFRAIANDSPHPLDKSLHIHFALGELDLDVDAANELAAPTERLTATERAAYLSAPDGIGRSKLAERLPRLANTPLTARNGNTVTKLLALLDEAG